MRKIWKFRIESDTEPQIIQMPEGRILCVQMQEGFAHVWVIVDPSGEMKSRTFKIFATGEAIENIDSFRYIGTFQEIGGMLVWHLFEKIA